MQVNNNISSSDLTKKNQDFEKLVISLRDEDKLKEFASKYYNYKVSLLPQILGAVLVYAGNFVYGKQPSYIKFRAVEVIARVPYQSWSSAAYTLLTLFYTDEKKAIELGHIKTFARHANDNETMHVVVMSHIVKEEHRHANVFLHSIIPITFSFFYFWASYIFFLVNKKWSYELNYVFENHAYEQYTTFIHRYEDKLKQKEISSSFLEWYGRKHANQYEFLRDVSIDELIHRNYSLEECERVCRG